MRFWGIGFGLPHPYARPDERTIIRIALGFGSGDLNPHFFNYDTLFMYILICLYILYYLFGLISGRYAGTADFIQEYVIDASNFHLIARCLSAFLGVLTVYVLYQIVKRLFGKKEAIVSSFFLSLTYLHVRDSHFGTTDIAATLFIEVSETN